MSYRQPFEGDYPITQRYGEVVPGVTVNNKPHTGIDYGCPEGTPILASAEGQVMFEGWDRTGYGWCVIVKHGNGNATLYAHLSLIPRTIAVGVWVKQGEVIGYSGATGNCTGPHLHFEARKQWNETTSHFDPMDLPLMSFADANDSRQQAAGSRQLQGTGNGQPATESCILNPASSPVPLKDADELPEMVKVVCPDGAKVCNPDWSMRYAGFPQGTVLHFTGRTAERPGFPYTYCEVYEEPRKFFVAVHDGRTQILGEVRNEE